MENLTTASAQLLAKCIASAEFEGDNGMDEALMNFTPQERGNLSDLKKKGFLETCEEEQGQFWVIFTEKARPLYEALK